MSKILVVDDELHITELLQMGLSYNGFDVTTATSGRSALQVLDSERPDLLVLDVMMADLDGFWRVPINWSRAYVSDASVIDD